MHVADRQQVGAAARAEAAGDKCVVHCCSFLAPVWVFDTALSEKAGSRFLGVAQAGSAAEKGSTWRKAYLPTFGGT